MRLFRQDVGLYPARHVCDKSGQNDSGRPPLPIIDLQTMNLKPQPNSDNSGGNNHQGVTSKTVERVEQAKAAVGKGWETVRNMNWRDLAARVEAAKKDEQPKPKEGAITWGKAVLNRVAEQLHHIRDGGNGKYLVTNR